MFMKLKHIFNNRNVIYAVSFVHAKKAVDGYKYMYFTTQVFGEYFTELEEESIRDNFVIIYELLDEIMDFGYPQTTESKILQE